MKTVDNAILIINFVVYRMPRRILRKFYPDPNTLKQHKHLQFLGDTLHAPFLWHLTRHAIARAFAVGLFAMWIPLPFQSVIAAVLAVVFQANLPVAVALVFLTNPVTTPPMLFAAYELGALFLGHPAAGFSFEPTMAWVTNSLVLIWKPFVLGLSLSAILSTVFGYYGIHLLWRFIILRRLKTRRERWAKRRAPTLTATPLSQTDSGVG